MSKEEKASGQVDDNSVIENEQKDEESQYVPKKAYEGVTKDLHKFKSKAKEQAAYAAELEAKLKSIEEEKMQDQQQWKELFEKRTSELESLKNEVRQREEQYLTAVKRNALKNELGGKVKDEYLQHANLDQIQFTENGVIDQESLLSVANNFREHHSQLIPVESKSQATGMASPSDSTVGSSLKPLNQMSIAEKKALLNNPALQEQYKKHGLL